jgi:hypothetical protein
MGTTRPVTCAVTQGVRPLTEDSFVAFFSSDRVIQRIFADSRLAAPPHWGQ